MCAGRLPETMSDCICFSLLELSYLKCADCRLLSQLPTDFVRELSARILHKLALELERVYVLLDGDRHWLRLNEIVNCQVQISSVLNNLHDNGVDYDVLTVQESYSLVLQMKKYVV